jgi:small subunit ribosomal protein S1
VTKIVAFGAFVQLTDYDVEALIHVNEISDHPFPKIEDVVAKGETITAVVIKIDPDLKKIALSRKEYLMKGAAQGSGDEISVGKARRANKKKTVRDDHSEEDEE